MVLNRMDVISWLRRQVGQQRERNWIPTLTIDGRLGRTQAHNLKLSTLAGTSMSA